MAVLAGIYGKTEPEYVGCVLQTYEQNGYQDSDWYAVCWDEEQSKIVVINYDTTRAGGGGWAEVDATPEVIRKAYRYYFKIFRYEFDHFWNKHQAKVIRVGDTLKVVRGRKISKGSVGKCFWKGSCYNYHSHREEERVGIEFNGERAFLPAEYVEVVEWENRLITGKDRKHRIRNETLKKMPGYTLTTLEPTNLF